MKQRSDAWALLALSLLPMLWYATPLFSDANYYIGDLTAQYRPWWTFAHDHLREGKLPLWNPYVFGGTPYHVNPENALFYPLKLPLVFLSVFTGVAVLRVLNCMVASVGMFLLIRSLGARTLPAFLGAVMFTYGSFMSYKFLHIP